MTGIKKGSQIAADRDLLAFKSYEEYLDSLVKPSDLEYLRSSRFARQLAELGYRTNGETLDKESFYRRQRAVKDLLFPVYRPYVLDSELTTPKDELHRQLALRERSNRLGVLSTIIHIRCVSKQNHQISGYIDFAHRLQTDKWRDVFHDRKEISPRKTDLAYYNWRLNKTLLNESPNYRSIVDQKYGLCFANVHDSFVVTVDPGAVTPGVNTTRTQIYSAQYNNIVLYDHEVR